MCLSEGCVFATVLAPEVNSGRVRMPNHQMRVAPRTRSSRRFVYELVPLLELPRVDLSVSIKSRLGSRLLDRAVRVVTRSLLTLVSFIIFVFIFIGVFVLPASIGRILAVLGVLLGTPATLAIITTLRYDLVCVLLKTYDIWFFVATSNIASIVLFLLLNDARSILPVISWVLYLVNIFVDANLFGLRSVWVGNVFAAIGYLTITACISVGLTPALHEFDVVHVNTHTLPAIAVVRDCHFTMVLGIIRNLSRRARQVVSRTNKNASEASTHYRTINCVSFRCRLQLRSLEVEHRTRKKAAHQTSRPHSPSIKTTKAAAELVQLTHTPFGMSIDARNTLVKIPHETWRRIVHNDPISHRFLFWLRQALKAIAVVGLSATNLSNSTISGVPLFTGSASPHHFKSFVYVATVGVTSTLVFSGVSLAVAQRHLLYALMTSFDFIFTAAQLSMLHLAMMEMCRWIPSTTISLLSSWLWSLYLLYWDALTPVVRFHLGLSHRFAAWIAISLVVTLLTNAFLIFVVLPPTALRDRAIATIHILGNVVEFRTVSWFFSSSITVLAWSCRLMWRLWHAKDGELVVLDGPVTYARRTRAHRVHVSPRQQILVAVVPQP